MRSKSSGAQFVDQNRSYKMGTSLVQLNQTVQTGALLTKHFLNPSNFWFSTTSSNAEKANDASEGQEIKRRLNLN